MTRRFDVSVYARRGVKNQVVLDASPWGIGGYQKHDNKIVSCYWEAIEDAEATRNNVLHPVQNTDFDEMPVTGHAIVRDIFRPY